MKKIIEELVSEIERMPLPEKVSALNEVRRALHEISPFRTEPVDCVLWKKADLICANDYNPNAVAPPEMALLETSILNDGYTQPIVGWQNGSEIVEVVDGFHRNRVGKESEPVRQRIHGYLPVALINTNRQDRSDRIASTIRHNRARGKHKVEAMSDIVVELKRRNWTDDKIAQNLGMEQDEILRLCQITGLAEMFTNQEFSKSWDIEGEITESDFQELTDDVATYGELVEEFREVNTGGEDRIFHTHDEWECYKAGFYATIKEGMTKAECEEAYREFLSDIPRFEATLGRIITEWKNSCEHYLTNSSMNRIAWLGQASLCYALGIPAVFRGGFSLLTQEQQDRANGVALVYLNKWFKSNNRAELTMEEAYSGRQVDLY